MVKNARVLLKNTFTYAGSLPAVEPSVYCTRLGAYLIMGTLPVTSSSVLAKHDPELVHFTHTALCCGVISCIFCPTLSLLLSQLLASVCVRACMCAV